MLKTRLWMGAILVLLGVGILALDRWLAPWFPFLFLTVLGLGWAAGRELLLLLPRESRPSSWLTLTVLLLILAGNWLPAVREQWPGSIPSSLGPWELTSGLLLAGMLALFFFEMARFREPGIGTPRVAYGTWILAYIGLTGSCLAQLRWVVPTNSWSLPLALVFFVPKAGDIGAYTIGRLFGRHRFSPLLSPNKTWQGAAGGFIASVAMTIGLMAAGDQINNWPLVIAFGAILAVVSQLGDLAESMVKRDSRVKDAAGSVPGFGGILDVIDSILFAAPVVYLYWVLT